MHCDLDIRARPDPAVLEHAVVEAGGIAHAADAGATAFRWHGLPEAFVLLRSGRVRVRFRTKRASLPWAECRAFAGQDCMPVSAAILSGSPITVQAVCLEPSTWLELEPQAFIRLVEEDTAFRTALFARHAARLPQFFRRISEKGVETTDQRLAAWLIAQGQVNPIVATHREIAVDLVTAREVVSRRLKCFADKGWILQARGRIEVMAQGALSRVARGSSTWCVSGRQTRRDMR